MTYLWVRCARNIVLMALLFCLQNIDNCFAMNSDMNSEGFKKSFLNYMKKAPQLAATVDESSCLPASCYSFKWKRIPAWTFKWPSTWTFGCRKNKIFVTSENVAFTPSDEEENMLFSKGNDSKKIYPQAGDEENNRTDYEISDIYQKTLNNSCSPTVINHKKAYNSLEADISPVSGKKTIRMVVVEDEPLKLEKIESYIEIINNDSSEDYTIEAKYYTHAIFAIEDMRSNGNFLPHIFLTDNNLEKISVVNNKTGKEDPSHLTGGCEAAKFLLHKKDKLGNSTSVFNRRLISTDISVREKKIVSQTTQKEYADKSVVCRYSDELIEYGIERLDMLIFLVTSDSKEELGEDNVSLFCDVYNKIKYLRDFKKVFTDHKVEISKISNKFK